MNFLEKAKKLEKNDELEILDLPHLKMLAPTVPTEKTDKRKGVATVLERGKQELVPPMHRS